MGKLAMNRLALLIAVLIVCFMFVPSITLKALAVIGWLLLITSAIVLIITGSVVWFYVIAACRQSATLIRSSNIEREQWPKQITNRSVEERATSSAMNGRPTRNRVTSDHDLES